MAGSITQEDRDFVEKWGHVSPQQWGIIRLDPRGEEKHEIISGERAFFITTEERLITQDKIKDPKNDPFLNGSFRPMVVPDSITTETNPNALSDDEIMKILVSSDIAWSENLKAIDSVATLRRMLAVAEDYDEMTVKRLRQLENRLVDVRGENRLLIKDPELASFMDDRPSHLRQTVSGGGNPRRRSISGGRSSDYRP